MVDDIATNRMILRAKLSAAYFDVILAESGRDALEKIRQEQPDIVLLDVLMPDMDGFEVCKILKANPETAHVPVLMVTAHYSQTQRLRGLECGADDFLSKPINDLALFSRVRNLIRVKFMFDELRLRNTISRDFGFGVEWPPPPTARDLGGHVVLACPNETVGRKWRQDLLAQLPITVDIETSEDQVAEPEAGNAPDIFVVHSRIGKHGDGLRLVSRLRTRPRTRHALIILVVPQGDQTLAAKGLDLGASDYVFDPFDPQEMIIRLQSQMRRKHISDGLRNAVQDSLRLSVLDPLTGLYNRRYATEHLDKINSRSQETGKPFALMLLDIDNFKRVNDAHGHPTGDRVLKEFAQRIQDNMRGVDLVSRLGGEEFLVAMPDTTQDEARIAGERLRRVIEQDFFELQSANKHLSITVSIGVTVGSAEPAEVDVLLQEADQALYASKAEGRNQVTLFSSAA